MKHLITININTKDIEAGGKPQVETIEETYPEHVHHRMTKVEQMIKDLKKEMNFNPDAETRWQIDGQDRTIGQVLMWILTNAEFKETK